MVQVRDNNFASVTSDHELKQFLVVRNFNPRASVACGVTSRVSLWLSAALALELRNSQPQSVLRFCVFGGQRFAAEIRVA